VEGEMPKYKGVGVLGQNKEVAWLLPHVCHHH